MSSSCFVLAPGVLPTCEEKQPTNQILDVHKSDQRFRHVSRGGPPDLLLSRPQNQRLPLLKIDRPHPRQRLHIRLLRRQEIVHEPPDIHQRPANLLLRAQGFAKLTMRGRVEAWELRERRDVPAVFGGD